MKWDLHVTGMHCASCEFIIERKLGRVKGVKSVKVNKRKHHVQVQGDVTIEQLQGALKGTEYTLMRESPAKTQKASWVDIGAAFVIILGLYAVLDRSNLIPSVGVSENMTLGMVFFLGLVAATSTCLAVSGGLLLSLTAAFNERFPHASRMERYRPHIAFNLGRLISYTLFGALIGYVGSALTLSSQVTGIITLLAALLMIAIGLQMLQVFPWLSKLRLALPKNFAHKLYTKSEKPSKHFTSGAFLFGTATFFLPCGFTQALQLYVLAQGDPMVGASLLFVFALGTLPSFVAIGALTNMVQGDVRNKAMTFAAVLIVLMGAFSLPSGLALMGTQSADATTPVELVDGVQVVRMKVQGLEYTPHQFTIKQNVPVRWVIEGQGAIGCGQILTAPKLGISEMLERNEETVIEFTPKEVGSIPFHCSMAMTTAGAQFIVVQ